MTPGPQDPPALLGSYEVLGKIAEGGMGTVYRARHRATGEVVAVKVVAPGTTRNPVTLQRFEREFTAARGLDHPNVVRAIEYCGTGPSPFLVMEFVDGESLGQRVERDGALPEAEAVRLIAQVCDGLHRAHKQGLVHRDVKPDNVLVTKSGVAKLTDLGLVKEVDADLNLTKTGRGLGTPHYMAPEQFRNAKGVDVRGDVYSLGATLYALVTGRVPFADTNPLDCWMKKVRNEFPAPKEVVPELSDRVDWAIRRAMSADPDQRPASCREFVEDLTGRARAAATTPGPARTPPAADLWYMVYRDAEGRAQTVKGATDGIRRALRDGLLGDTGAILVGRSKTGQFLPLTAVPEFRDLVVVPAALPADGRPRGASSGRLAGGLVTTPAPVPTPRPGRPVGDDVVDLGGDLPGGPGGSASSASSASRSGRSGRSTPPALTGRYPSPRVVGPTPAGSDAHAETVSQPPLAEELDDADEPRRGFDWTPVVAILVALVSLAAGLLLFNRR